MVRPGGVCAQLSGQHRAANYQAASAKVLRRQETCGGIWGNHQQLSDRTRKSPTSGAGLGGNFMVVERDEFFAELDGLTEKEIEARLDLWDQEQLALIQEYLDQRVLAPGQSRAGGADKGRTKCPRCRSGFFGGSCEHRQYQSHGRAYLVGRGNAGSDGVRARGLSSSARLDDFLVTDRVSARCPAHAILAARKLEDHEGNSGGVEITLLSRLTHQTCHL